MANPKNLKPPYTSDQSPEEASINGRKGGIASGKARREKADLRKMCQMVLEMDVKGKDGTMKSGAEGMVLAQLQKALKGDAKAFELLRDTSGQKPVEKVMLAEVDQSVINEVEKAVLEDNEN